MVLQHALFASLAGGSTRALNPSVSACLRSQQWPWLTGIAFSPYDHALYVAAYGDDVPAQAAAASKAGAAKRRKHALPAILRFSPGTLRWVGSTAAHAVAAARLGWPEQSANVTPCRQDSRHAPQTRGPGLSSSGLIIVARHQCHGTACVAGMCSAYTAN